MTRSDTPARPDPAGMEAFATVESVRDLIETWADATGAVIGTRVIETPRRRGDSAWKQRSIPGTLKVMAWDLEARVIVFLPRHVANNGKGRRAGSLAIHGPVGGWPLRLAAYLTEVVPWLASGEPVTPAPPPPAGDAVELPSVVEVMGLALDYAEARRIALRSPDEPACWESYEAAKVALRAAVHALAQTPLK